MKTLFTNFQMFVTIGALVIAYFYLMNWSLKWFISFRDTISRPNTAFDWQEIVAIPVYILTWGPLILIMVAFFGGFVYLIYTLFISMISIL